MPIVRQAWASAEIRKVTSSKTEACRAMKSNKSADCRYGDTTRAMRRPLQKAAKTALKYAKRSTSSLLGSRATSHWQWLWRKKQQDLDIIDGYHQNRKTRRPERKHQPKHKAGVDTDAVRLSAPVGLIDPAKLGASKKVILTKLSPNYLLATREDMGQLESKQASSNLPRRQLYMLSVEDIHDTAQRSSKRLPSLGGTVLDLRK